MSSKLASVGKQASAALSKVSQPASKRLHGNHLAEPINSHCRAPAAFFAATTEAVQSRRAS